MNKQEKEKYKLEIMENAFEAFRNAKKRVLPDDYLNRTVYLIFDNADKELKEVENQKGKVSPALSNV